jgi:hypothetical protein
MLPITQNPQLETPRPHGGWGLPALAAGAVILVVIALVAIPMADRPVELAPASTPEGVVQRFFDATYRGDYVAAYAMLSDETRRELSLAEFQARMRYERESELRVDDVALHGETATVTVTVTHYSPGGLFGGDEWSTRYDLLLEQEGDTWRILGEPFW